MISRIAVLRNDIKAIPNQTPSSAESHQKPQEKRPGAGRELPTTRKKVRHKYSQRCPDRHVCDQLGGVERRSAKFQDLQHPDPGVQAPGEIAACTPLLRRARGHIVPSPEQESEVRKARKYFGRNRNSDGIGDAMTVVDLGQGVASMRSELPATRYGDYEAIFRSLETVLKGTKHESMKERGASSFLSMCLRKVPDYIAGVQAWELHEAEKNGTKSTLDSSDVSFQIYSELENLSPSASGWRHLRTVVRAHGLKAVRDAMAEGLFSDEFSEQLIYLCFNNGVAAEVDDLIEVYVSQGREYPCPQRPDSTFKEIPCLRPLQFVWEFSYGTGRTSCLLRQYTKLLSNGLLPHEWLTTRQFEPVWKLANRILSRGNGASDAVTFLITAIAILCRKIRYNGMRTSELDAMATYKQTLSSALAILSAMNILGENELQVDGSPAKELGSVAIIGRNLTYIFYACGTEIGSGRGRRRNLGEDLLHLALFLSSSRTLPDDEGKSWLRSAIESTCSDLDASSSTNARRRRHNYDTLVLFISSTAKICSRGTSQASHDYLNGLCQRLRLLGLQDDTLNRLTRAGAFILAQQTNNLRDLMYAEKLVHNTTTMANVSEDRARADTLFVGYRWEDTIGEWVTVSPPLERKTYKRRSLRLPAGYVRSMGPILRAEEQPMRPISSTPLTVSQPGSGNCPSYHRPSSKTGPGGSATRNTSLALCLPDFNGGHTRLPNCTALDSGSMFSFLEDTEDELGDDKENRYQVNRRERQQLGSEAAAPGMKRRSVRFSGGCHSDDELGV